MRNNILVIAAMEDVELNYLISKLSKKKEIEYKGFKFFEGKLANKNVILCVSNIGTINAGIALTIAIERYTPSVIINEGVAGGYTTDTRKGNIVIVEEAINITSAEYKGTGNLITDYELTTFLHNEENRLIIQKANDELIKLIKEKFSKYDFNFGRLASGDVWNKNPDIIKHINKKYNVICEDMEGISIYTVANLYEIPVISIKGIANNEVLREEYDYSVGEKLQRFVEELVEVI